MFTCKKKNMTYRSGKKREIGTAIYWTNNDLHLYI